MTTEIDTALAFLRNHLARRPRLAIILGSGLGGTVGQLSEREEIAAADIPGYPKSTVEGHRGIWATGLVDSHPVLVMAGRVHFYEGYSMESITLPVRLMAGMGVTHLIVTNAAGSMNPGIRPGDLMLIDDHINLFYDSPLITRSPQPPNKRFIDLSAPYDPALMALAETVARDLKISLRRGVLAGSSGPSYESAAEISMMRTMGADAATMSTIPEVITANQQDLKVLGLSCITNMATGMTENRLTHAEVTEVAARVSQTFNALITGIIAAICTSMIE